MTISPETLQRIGNAMNDMLPKYIVWDNGLDEKIEIFPTTITHADRARQLRLREHTILSAGFFRIEIENGKPIARAFGYSETLKTQTRGESDDYLINKMLRIGSFFED